MVVMCVWDLFFIIRNKCKILSYKESFPFARGIGSFRKRKRFYSKSNSPKNSGQ